MISKAKIKELSAYKTAKMCDQEQVFVVEGTKMVQEALSSDFEVETICALEEWFIENRTLVRKKINPENTFEVTNAELERLSGMKTPNQVWMLVKRKTFTVTISDNRMTLVLDKIQDPGNMGTIIRTCDWFGIRNIVCSPDTVNCYNPKVVQSTMGGIFRTNIEYADLAPLLDECHKENIPIYGGILGGENIYQSELSKQKGILVIGNESKGISPEIADKITHRLMIPNIGHTCESLNASVATAILLSEFCRSEE